MFMYEAIGSLVFNAPAIEASSFTEHGGVNYCVKREDDLLLN